MEGIVIRREPSGVANCVAAMKGTVAGMMTAIHYSNPSLIASKCFRFASCINSPKVSFLPPGKRLAFKMKR